MSASNQTRETHTTPNKIRQGRKLRPVPQQGASNALLTSAVMPPAVATEHDEIGGHIIGDDHGMCAPGVERAVVARRRSSPATTHEIGDGNVSGGERASHDMSTTALLPVAANTEAIDLLVELQRQRRFAIVSQSRSDRACEAFIARRLGYRPDLPEKEGKAIWKQTAAMRKAVEKGGEGQTQTDNQATHALAACTPIILNSAVARQTWDKHRAQTEKSMRKLARSLHVWPWVESVAGFGDLGLAIIVGETGDLTRYGSEGTIGYATKEKVWKRLGLAVIEGERQQRKTGLEAAAAHGYNPKRRAEIWTVADSLFKHQYAGAKDEDGADPKKSGKPVAVPAHAVGPYGDAYGRRKAYMQFRNDGGELAERAAQIVAATRRAGKTPNPDNIAGKLTAKHIDNDARRIMTKALIETLWRVWNGLPPLQEGPG